MSAPSLPGHLLELVDEVIWTATLSYKLLYANPALARVYGRPIADFHHNLGL